jgi:eukaryotic-like serine/threonine-protein kinase
MKCYPKSELQEYLLERLEPQRDAEVSQHLQQCHACRSSLDALSDDEVVRDYLDAVRREEQAGEQVPTLPVPEPNAKKFDANWIAALIDQRDLPKRFGRFELRELLGSGGFGAVYLAWDTELGRQVAIKIPHLVRLSPLFRKRFLQEARAAASLCHPNIVSVLESGEFEGIGYIVSEYIPGPTLREHLRTRRPRFRATDAANLVCALAKAIDHAHQHKIVHRDIKPSNVLLDERTRTGALPFRPMLTDFGTARLVDADQSATVEEVLIGTAPYMAPEQIMSGDIRLESDIYALGVLLFELISGHPPIQGFDSTTTMHRIATMDNPELRDTVAGVPRDLSAICSKCLEKDPKQRYASAANLAEDLQRFLDHVPTIARPIGTGRRIARWCRRNPIPSTVVAATFFSLALIIADQSWNAATLRSVNQLLTDANKRVEKSEKRTRVLLYAADLRLAKLSWNQGDIQTARELVSRYIPLSGEDDLRGIEWHFLEKELRPNQYLIANHGKPLYDLAINPAQGTFATAGQAGLIVSAQEYHCHDSAMRWAGR